MIANEIKKMKYNESHGIDGISLKLLKESVEQISTPLAKFCNLSKTCVANLLCFWKKLQSG